MSGDEAVYEGAKRGLKRGGTYEGGRVGSKTLVKKGWSQLISTKGG